MIRARELVESLLSGHSGGFSGQPFADPRHPLAYRSVYSNIHPDDQQAQMPAGKLKFPSFIPEPDFLDGDHRATMLVPLFADL